MRRLIFALVLATPACGPNDSTTGPTDAPVVASPSPAATASPTVGVATPVRLTIAAYSASGTLVVTWPVGALVTLEAVPVCTQTTASSAQVRIVGLDAGHRVALPATRADVRRLRDTCRLPAWIDWDLSGAPCSKRGDTNGSALTVQCTLVGELRVEAVSREVRSGPEVARGTGQFRVTP